MPAKFIKTVRSYSGHARLLAEFSEEPVGFIPRQTEIPSPYRSSPTEAVYEWKGRKVFIHETSHKVYSVFEVPAEETVTDDATATDVFIARITKK